MSPDPSADPARLVVLHTPRLRLEPIVERHLDGLHEMDRLPEVMRYISGEPSTREQTAAVIARAQRGWAAWGTGWWAFIEPDSGRVAGAGCIQYARYTLELPADLKSLMSNPLEIGWRLHPDFWGKGLATEAARRMADFAFDQLDAPELIAVRHADNAASARVMDRLGMRFRGLEGWYGFNDPTHVLTREAWLSTRGGPAGVQPTAMP